MLALRLDGAASGYEGEARGWRSWDVTVSSTGVWGFPVAEGAWAGEVAEVGGHVEGQGLERGAGDAVCWVTSWDGADTCDGCGALEVDGVSAGADCAG